MTLLDLFLFVLKLRTSWTLTVFYNRSQHSFRSRKRFAHPLLLVLPAISAVRDNILCIIGERAAHVACHNLEGEISCLCKLTSAAIAATAQKTHCLRCMADKTARRCKDKTESARASN